MERLWLGYFADLFANSTVTVMGLIVGHYTMGLKVTRRYLADALVMLSDVQYLDVRPVMHCKCIRSLTPPEADAVSLACGDTHPQLMIAPQEYSAGTRAFALDCPDGLFKIWALHAWVREPYSTECQLGQLRWEPDSPIWPGGPNLSELLAH